MNFRLAALTFILTCGTLATGQTLRPLRIQAHADSGTILKKCGEALEQLKAERTEIEARENFSCFAILPGKDVATVEAGFMVLCERSIDMREEATSSADIELNIEVLRNAFNTPYRPLIATSCAHREAQRISNYNSAHSGNTSVSSGSGQGMREGCFATSSCW
jgi:hypothetical protein